MTNILPYNQELENNNYTFIKPSGLTLTNPLLTFESFAYFYTNNLFLEFHKRLLNLPFNYNNEILNYMHNSFDIENNDFKKVIETLGNEYSFWQLFKNSSNFSSFNDFDFLISILGFDLIINNKETNKKIIITTNENPYVKYYNYSLMDYVIEFKNKLEYDQDTNTFKELNNNTSLDKEISLEIRDIKRKVLLKDRINYFK